MRHKCMIIQRGKKRISLLFINMKELESASCTTFLSNHFSHQSIIVEKKKTSPFLHFSLLRSVSRHNAKVKRVAHAISCWLLEREHEKETKRMIVGRILKRRRMTEKETWWSECNLQRKREREGDAAWCSGGGDDDVDGTCTLGGSWSWTELDHDD